MFFKSAPALTPQIVEKLLRTVPDSSTQQTLEELNIIDGVSIHGTEIRIALRLNPTLHPERTQALQQSIEEQLSRHYKNISTRLLFTQEAKPSPTPEKPKAHFSSTPLDFVKQIIVVASGKGGVGKSTCAMLLAYALQQKGLRIGILDADIYGPSLPLLTGLQQQPDFHQGKIVPLQHHDIQVLSAGYIMGEQAAVLRGPMITKALQQMLRGAAWGSHASPLDYLIIDTPPGTGDIAISLAQMLPLREAEHGVLMVTTPQEIALSDVRRCIEAYQKLGVRILGIIENMSFFEDESGKRHAVFGTGGGEKLAEESQAPLLGQIPLLTSLAETLQKGHIPNENPVVTVAELLRELG